MRYEFDGSFVVPADLPRAFRQKTKSSSFPAKNGNHTEWAALRVVVVWAWAKHQRVFWRVSADSCSELLEEQDRALLV